LIKNVFITYSDAGKCTAAYYESKSSKLAFLRTPCNSVFGNPSNKEMQLDLICAKKHKKEPVLLLSNLKSSGFSSFRVSCKPVFGTLLKDICLFLEDVESESIMAPCKGYSIRLKDSNELEDILTGFIHPMATSSTNKQIIMFSLIYKGAEFCFSAIDYNSHISDISYSIFKWHKVDCNTKAETKINICSMHTDILPAVSSSNNILYTCKDHTRIQRLHVCNNIADCSEGDDELYCGYDHKFTCEDGYTISYSHVCDWFHDCIDGSDENNIYCLSKNCDNMFQCNTGQCVTRTKKCDGYYDCLDKSDEVNCTETIKQSIHSQQKINGAVKLSCLHDSNQHYDLSTSCVFEENI